MSPERIGHYLITSKLGEGGMGAVYRATDPKLNRDVAIKVLPDVLANDPDYLARFAREAQVLASLNHPNIATIYGVEDCALVMELVPGQTLAERIEAGPIPLDEALGIARQIAEALEAAHEKGVIHRDLKPANVKVTPEGVVKVLDFGLAKAADPVSSVSGANSPTLTIRSTQLGLILGTAGYMAPEQAAGKPVDRRADIWSFGVVLYELLTGRTLFTGETISHTLASVLKDRIDFDLPQAPPPIRRLLSRCLNRDAKERLRDIGEARIAIRDYLANPVTAEPPAPQPAAATPAPAKGFRYWIPRMLFAVALGGAAAAVAWMVKPSQPLRVARFTHILGEEQVFSNLGRRSVAISPDGTQVVYVANRRLYLRALAELEGRPIAGTGSDNQASLNPGFSPDGKSLAFFESRSQLLKRIAVSGGTAVTICPAVNLTGFSWNEQGILFATADSGIQRVSPNGGQPEPVVIARNDEMMADPQILPGGGAVLFSLRGDGGPSAGPDGSRVVVQTLKTGARKILVNNASSARYLPTGHLVYSQGGVLYAVPFHLGRLETTGTTVGLVEGVARAGSVSQFAVSDSGSLVYLPGSANAGTSQNVLALVDRKGDVEPLKFPPAAYAYPRVSRDGKRATYQIADGKESGIWIVELTGSTAPRRLTLPGTGTNRYPVWSPDGLKVAFQSDREGDLGIWWQRADGAGVAERLTKPDQGVSHIPDSWSPDGQTVSFTQEKNRLSEIWTWSLRDKTATLLATDPGLPLGRSAFSPDGRWVAYQAASQPNSRLYIRPFPSTATAYLAPQDGDSHHPLWSPDGKELFYIAGPSQFGALSVQTQPSVSFGSPVRAPKSGFTTAMSGIVRPYDVMPDGQHFIGVVPAGDARSSAGSAQIQVVLNWFEELRQRAPAN